MKMAEGQASGSQPSNSFLSPPSPEVPVSSFAGLDPVSVVSNPVSESRPCACLDEALVELGSEGPVFYVDAYVAKGILPARPGRLRSGVVERLNQAAARLPDGYSLAVLDAYRSLTDQAALGQFYGSQSVSSGFVAPVHPGYRPPHTTGGAVDLTLAWRGRPLALGTDFDDFTPLAATGAFEKPGRDERIRLLRRALAVVLGESGFVNHRLGSEWWHWSFGDNTWADLNDCDSLYDIAEAG